MKSTYGAEALYCDCPYCRKQLIFPDHPILHEIEEKSHREVCYKCGKTFWLKEEK